MNKLKYILLAIVILNLILTPIYVIKKTHTINKDSGIIYNKVVNIWHIDTFEGGKGSRLNFLKERATAFEKFNNVLFLISSHTVESAKDALKKLAPPDLISYGNGLSEVVSFIKELNVNIFNGGAINKKNFAVPWCYGKYVMYSVKGEINLEEINGKISVSSLNNNLPQINLIKKNIFATEKIKISHNKSLEAYIDFISNKSDYLLGTQRDLFRLRTKGINFYSKSLNEFSDLYQYISILSEDKNTQLVANKFINYLISEESQKKLTNIGMFSHYYKIYKQKDHELQDLEEEKIKYTISAFTSDNNLLEMRQNSLCANQGDLSIIKNIENNLIYI